MNITSFSQSKRDKPKKHIQTLLNKYHKITADIRYENEANRTIFAILSFFSKELYIKQVFRQQARKHAKTLLKYKGA